MAQPMPEAFSKFRTFSEARSSQREGNTELVLVFQGVNKTLDSHLATKLKQTALFFPGPPSSAGGHTQ